MQHFYSSQDMSSNTATISCVSQIYCLTVFKIWDCRNRTCDIYLTFLSNTAWMFLHPTRKSADCNVWTRVTHIETPRSKSCRLTDGRQQLCSHWLTSWHPPVGVWYEGQRGTVVWWIRSESNKRINKVFRMKISCSDNQTTTSRCGLIDWLIVWSFLIEWVKPVFALSFTLL